MIYRSLMLTPIALLVCLLAACAGQPAAEENASDSSGPTIYGQLGVSVDHVSVK